MKNILQTLSIAISVIGFLFLSIPSAFAVIEPITFTEDFSASTYFDSAASGDFGLWTTDGAQLIYDTNHAVPSPFMHDHNGSYIKISETVGDYIYSAGYGSSASTYLYVYDIAAETYTSFNVSAEVDATIQDMYADTANNLLFVVWSNNAVGGITIVDISVPSTPVLQGSITGYPYAQHIVVDETFLNLYVVSNGPVPVLTSFGVDEGAPFVFDEIALTTNVTYNNIIKHPTGDMVFIGGSNINAPMTAIDISNVAGLAAGTFSGDAFGMNVINDTKMVGNYMFAVGDNSTGDPVAKLLRIYAGLQVLDISTYAFTDTSDMPRVIAEGETSGGNTIFYVNTDAASIVRMDVFKVTTTLPEFSGAPISLEGSTAVDATSATIPSYANLAGVGERLFLPNFSQGLVEINVEDQNNPGTPVYDLALGGSGADVIVVGENAYITNSTSQTIQRIAISDPTAMSVAASVSTAACGAPTRLAYEETDSILSAACGNYYTYDELDDGLDIPDVINTGEAINGIALVTGYAYLARNTGLAVYNLTTSAQEGSTIGSIGTPTGLTTQGNYLYIASNTGIHVFDITTTSAPSFVRTYNTSGTEVDVDAYGEYLYIVGNNLEAILISELTNASNANYAEPIVNQLNTQTASRLEVRNGYAHIGDNGGASDAYQLVNVRDAANMTAITLNTGLTASVLGGGFGFKDGWVFVADGANLRASHMVYPISKSVISTAIDTVSTEILSINYTFNQTINNGNVRYYASNNNGANWYYLGIATTDSAVTGSTTFPTVGSKLMWKAVIYADTIDYHTSPVITGVSLEYVYNETLVEDVTGPTVTAFAEGDERYDGPQTVELTASEPGSTIYYTLDSSTPNTSSTVYDPQNPLQIANDTTVSAIAVDTSLNAGTILSVGYLIDLTPDTTAPSSMVDPGSFLGSNGPFSAPFSVELVCEDTIDYNPSIRYTTDGSSPTTSSSLYITPITISEDTTLTFNCTDASNNTEAINNQETYEFTTLVEDVTAPTSVIQPPAGTYPSGTSISIEVSDDYDATPITYYTLDGTTPSSVNGFVYTVPFSIFIDTTVKFFSIDASGNAETVRTKTYVIGGEDEDLSVIPTVEEPELDPAYIPDADDPTLTITPAGGTYATPQTVQLTCEDTLDPNPTIYYTRGLAISSLVYEEPILVESNITIRAYCKDASDNRSATVTESYIITHSVIDTVAPTTISSCPSDGYFGTLNVELTVEDDNDANPAIYYSTDGTDPIRLAAFTYKRPIVLSATTTLKFFAYDASRNKEEISSNICTVYDENKLNLTAKNKKKGVGNVRIVTAKNKKVLKTFKAFNKGGVKAEIVKVRGVKRVAAIQYKKSNLLKIFDLNGNLLGKKKFRKKKSAHQIKAGNLYKGKANGEIIITKLKKKKGELFTREFAVTKKNKPKQKTSLTVSTGLDKLIAKGYKLQIKKKKLLVKTKKGKKAIVTMKLLKKGRKFKLKQL